uniref:Uncharacterized protein n=1 Tax=Candidatus Kentrum sp. SD TaxID=2126332 RepID=A0A451BKV7_9GAMM|nr:MAG: hypothetical protein BECKSD772D_GA0070982_102931 [Candidatus Kentron sp. SD]
MDLEIGRSSYYPEDSIYIRVGDNSIIMGRATAKRFVEAVMDVDHYQATRLALGTPRFSTPFAEKQDKD